MGSDAIAAQPIRILLVDDDLSFLSYPKVRVILISGSIFEDKRPHPDERGTDAYLEKSEVPERLHATILALAAETTAAPPSRTNA